MIDPAHQSAYHRGMPLFRHQSNQLANKAEEAKIAHLTVDAFMETKPVKLSPETTIRRAIELFLENKISGAPVVSDLGLLLGMVSEYDLLLQVASREDSSPIQYNSKIVGLRPQDTLKEALVLLYKHRIRRLPVVDKTGALLGMVSRSDILRQLLAGSDPAVKDETPNPQ